MMKYNFQTLKTEAHVFIEAEGYAMAQPWGDLVQREKLGAKGRKKSLRLVEHSLATIGQCMWRTEGGEMIKLWRADAFRNLFTEEQWKDRRYPR